MAIKKTALGNIPSLKASEKNRVGNLDCSKARTVNISCRVTYGNATKAVRVNLYYSPDGTHYDTVPFSYFNVDLTASTTVQETHIFDFPEIGYMDVEVENLDTSVTATNVMVFSNAIKWPEEK